MVVSSVMGSLRGMCAEIATRPLNSNFCLIDSRYRARFLYVSPCSRFISSSWKRDDDDDCGKGNFSGGGRSLAALPSEKGLAAGHVPLDVQEYWEQVLEGVDKPTAKRLLQYIDLSSPLGIDISRGSGSKPPVYSYFLEVKKQHPTKIILVRVGEFFETVGMDAILLVQHCGLNPMGREGNPPRAGCPRGNLRRTVSDLVEGAGLSVVVCEEAPEPYAYGTQRRNPKTRYIAAVVTPASPHFLHGLVDEDSDLLVDSAPPLLGIIPRVEGYAVIEVDAELRNVRVTEGITEDAVCARLYEGGLSPPLYLHVPSGGSGRERRLTEATIESEWEQRAKSVFRNQVGTIQKFNAPDPVQGMLTLVRRQLNLDADTHFTILPAATPSSRPRPLYYSTALNLGLHRARGIPSLLDSMIPAGAPLTARRWLRKLLLLPPPPTVGQAIQAACHALNESTYPMPSYPAISPANVVLKIRSRQANDVFFRELHALVKAVGLTCASPAYRQFAESLLVAVASETGHKLETSKIARSCNIALSQIHNVILDEDDYGIRNIRNRWQDSSLETDDLPDEDSFDRAVLNDNNKIGCLAEKSGLDPLIRMFSANEDYIGKVRIERIATIDAAVKAAKQNVENEAFKLLSIGLDAAQSHNFAKKESKPSKSSRGNYPSLFYDVNNNAVWLKVPRGKFSIGRITELEHPRDRNGKLESAAYSTASLEDAQNEYRRLCSDARDAIRKELRELSKRLEPILSDLASIAMFAVIASALDTHMREAKRRNWSLPQLNYGSTQFQSSTTTSIEDFSIDEFWPYWLDARPGYGEVVKNTLSLKGMVLLTGPNMAGKSTILRSTAAVALLAACGLAVPAAPTTRVPYFDAFMLRNFASDSPLEGRSAFAVEMTEMRYVLEDATQRSLVLLDELGKGTEPSAGAALAAAMLECLDDVKCKGIFATHLHSIFDLNLKLTNTINMCMKIAPEMKKQNYRARLQNNISKLQKKERMYPTWQIIPGISKTSLALEVAEDARLPGSLIARAEDLYQKINYGNNDNISYESFEEYDMNEAGDQVPRDHDNKLNQLIMSKDLEKVGAILQKNAEEVLEKAMSQDLDTAEKIKVQFLPVGFEPPVNTIGVSCVYIAHRKDGWFYVGSTDGLKERISDHRKRGGQSLVQDPYAEFIFVQIPQVSGAASTARAIEAAVIRALDASGFSLLSTVDARKRHFPNQS